MDDTLRSSDASAPVGTESNALERVSPEYYTDRAELSVGGMGRIVTACDRRLRRVVAIKELRADTPELRARFEREALLTARLQHPNIVTIHEAGRWPSGQPFYTMRLVPGRSFDKLIAEATTLEQRMALLPHALAIADALGYAHQQRVIHRDLKPSNVIAGEFGETVVIDWGLAKDLDDTSAEPGHRSLPHADAAATEIGEVLGTPVYMPPEQAEGMPADERADVYAIGTILYHMLSGSPPYTGNTTAEVIEAAKRAAPTPLRQRQPDVPSDLLTIVERAMAPDRDKRYANARELAADLRRFQTGQLVGAHRYTLGQLVRRWLVRHRTAVAVAGIATILLAVVGVASIRRILRAEQRANDERVLAQQHRASAEELMDFMLVDLKEKLEPIGKLELLDLVATKATGYYALRAEGRSDDDVRRYALALRNLGDVSTEKGDLVSALAVYRKSLDIVIVLAARYPADLTTQSDLAAAHERVGRALKNQGDAGSAVVEYRHALATRENLVVRDPDNLGEKHNVMVSHDSIGDLHLERGDLGAALAEYRVSLTLAEAALAKNPSARLGQRDVASSRSHVGDVLRAQGDLTGAMAEYRASLVLSEQLAATDPDNATAQRDLSLIYGKLGNVLTAQRDPEALPAYRKALAISEKLASLDPSNSTWQRDLAIGHLKVGDSLQKHKEVAGALMSYRASLAISERLSQQDPGNTAWQRDVTVAHSRVGEVLQAQGDLTGALAQFRAARAVRETLITRDPGNATWQRDLSINDNKIGEVLRAQGDLAGALAAQRDSLVIAEKLAARDPANADWQRDVAVGYFSVAEVQEAQGDRAGALESYRAALGLVEKLAARDASNKQLQEDIAELRGKLETCCRKPK
jgi:tetratricopeptide (TPR) repeat protein